MEYPLTEIIFFVLKKLLEPYNYICQVPGKQIRTKLVQSFNYWLKISPEKITQVSDIIEILHNSSLL
jgi:geranylgeranyl diphosphate synthase type 3